MNEHKKTRITLVESEQALDLIREIHTNPNITQRHLANKYHISLGKINFIIGALLASGLIKIDRFKKSTNKKGYSYVLTPAGALKRLELARAFLVRKAQEYEALKAEIAMISVSGKSGDGGNR